jgi:hypothetical protein
MASSYSLTAASAMFKIIYGELSENVYNSATPLLGRVKKNEKLNGSKYEFPVPQGYAGGVGSGSLPQANTAVYGDVQILRKKLYSVVEVEREAIKASEVSEGAFMEATKEVARKGVESWMRNMSRTLFHNGTGSLGTANVVTDNTGGNYTISITAATWKEANFEERDIVNIEAGNTDKFEILTVTPSTLSIIVQRLTGSQVPVSGDVIFMQGSENNDPTGLKAICDATTGTNYNVAVGRRWQSFQLAAGSATISTDLMNKVQLGIEKQIGKPANLIVTSYKQFEKLLNILEDAKRYPLLPRSEKLKGQISFNAIEFMSSVGPVPVVTDRFCDDDRMYFLNDSQIEVYHTVGMAQWFDEDGTVFLRSASEDKYSARYGAYLQSFINPAFQGVLTGLNVS